MKTKLDDLVHDVRNPVNSISVNAELAKVLVEQGGADQQVLTALDTILRECKKCRAVLESAPDYFRDSFQD